MYGTLNSIIFGEFKILFSQLCLFTFYVFNSIGRSILRFIIRTKLIIDYSLILCTNVLCEVYFIKILDQQFNPDICLSLQSSEYIISGHLKTWILSPQLTSRLVSWGSLLNRILVCFIFLLLLSSFNGMLFCTLFYCD